MTAGKAIYSILTSSSDVNALTGLRIYPEIAPPEAAAPFAVYTIDSVEPEPTKDATSRLDEVRTTIYVVGDNYATVQDAAEAIRAAIDRARGTFNGVGLDSANYDSEEITWDDNARQYVQEQRFTLRISRTGTIPNTGTDMITIQETDGTPSGQIDTLRVPSDRLSISGNTATLTMPTTSTDAATFPVQQDTTNVNVISSSAVTVNLGAAVISTASFYTLSSNSVTLTTAGTYLITCTLSLRATSQTNHDLVQFARMRQDGTRNIGAPNSTTIQSGEDAHNAGLLVTGLTQSDGTNVITIEVYSSPTTSDTVNVKGGELQIVRL